MKYVTVDGVRYVEVPNTTEFKIIRTDRAGVFFAEIESRDGSTMVLRNARRLWSWSGAASLSQLAVDGTSNPSGCKFPVSVSRIEVLGVIEVLDVTVSASLSIEGVPVWEA